MATRKRGRDNAARPRARRCRFERLEDRLLLADLLWHPSAKPQPPNMWGDAENWFDPAIGGKAAAAPGAGDTVTFKPLGSPLTVNVNTTGKQVAAMLVDKDSPLPGRSRPTCR